jgi:hypothetical protein
MSDSVELTINLFSRISHRGRRQGRIDPIIFDQKRAAEEPPNRCLNGCSPKARDKNRGFESRPSRHFSCL